MNVTSLISAMQSQGIISPPQKQAQSPDSQDLPGFLTSIIQQIQTTPQSAGTGPAAQLSPEGLKALTEKIAALLQGGEPLPVSLQSLTPENLAAQIAGMLQKNNGIFGIQPALTSDLAAFLSPEIQETVPKDDISPEDLAALLNEIRNWIAKDGDPAKIPFLLQTQDTAAPTDTALLLQQLKDKIAQLSPVTDETGREAILQLKEEIFRFLKDQGVEQPVVEHYLAALSKFLRQEKPPVPGASATAILSRMPALPAGNMETPATAAVQQDATERDALPRPQPPAAPSQKPDSSPQQPLTARIAGFGVSPSMIHALAATGDGGFGADGFGSQNGGQQQGLASGARNLEPVSVDTLNARNFTNYLTSARTLPSPLTQMVNMQLRRGLNARIESMTLQLEPAELGRLDIRLKFGKDGSIRAHLTVDKPETLALLQKDSHHLEKVLQQTGLDADENSLSFDLRQQGRQQSLEGYDGGNGGGDANELAAPVNGISAEKFLQAQIAIQTSGYITQSGVNIMV
ncbi:MAG: flagellar hook-length control protein FliK [Pseudomonadota bacterium]